MKKLTERITEKRSIVGEEREVVKRLKVENQEEKKGGKCLTYR